MALVSFVQFRFLLSSVLVLFFGYIAPCLNTVKAIIQQDAKSVREYLTYWCVFITIVYIGRILNLLRSQRNHPPELKVIFVLWLTLPYTQGALRIYSYIVKPYFEKYEENIDEKISTVTNEVRRRAARQFKTILWQLLLAPNDGVLTSALTGVSSLLGTPNNAWASLLGSAIDSPTTAPATASKPSNNEGAICVNLSSSTLSKKLLTEFSQMLRDGMFLEAWRGQDTSSSFCEIQLHSNGRHLIVSTACGDVDDEQCRASIIDEKTAKGDLPPSMSEDLTRISKKEIFRQSRLLSNIKAENDSNALIIPLLSVSDVSAEDEDSLVVSFSFPMDVLSTTACFIYANQLSVSDIAPSKQLTISLLAEGIDEAEGLQVGLQILLKTAKNNAVRVLNKSLRLGRVPRAAMRAAWNRWKDRTASASNDRKMPKSNSKVPMQFIQFNADDNFESVRAMVNTREPFRIDSKHGWKVINDNGESDDDYGELEE